MAHNRIRSGNTKGGFLHPDLDYGGSSVVVAGDQIFMVGCTGLALEGKSFVGEGDPVAQAHQALSNVRVLLQEAGSKIEDICMINVYTTDVSYVDLVYPVIADYLKGVIPTNTSITVKALAESYIDFEIDVWAVLPDDSKKGHHRVNVSNLGNNYLMKGLEFLTAGAVRANDHIFLQGQTGLSLDGSYFVGEKDPASQAHQAMSNVKELLFLAGGTLSDICKVTTYVKDPMVRPMVYPVIAEHLKGVCPVSTGVVVKSLSFETCDFQIDVFANIAQNENRGHERLRISDPNYLPDVDYPLSKVVLAGDGIFLQGQTGIDLEGQGFVGKGDPVSQAEKAMQNVEQLLKEAGSDLSDICKVTTYIPDHSHRKLIYPVIGQYLKGVHPASTGIVPMALANTEVDFEIDVFAVKSE